jgi:hypothetical protein
MDIYRVFHPATAQYTFSVAHGSFFKIYHVLGIKASHNKCKTIEIIPCILAEHNAIKLEFNNKRNGGK